MTYENQKELLEITQRLFEIMKLMRGIELTIGEMTVTMKNIKIAGQKVDDINV